MVDAINGAVPSQDGYSESKKVNSPKVTRGMIPVKWVSNNWVVCSEDDTEWYNYGSKQWANVMLSDGTYKADTVKSRTSSRRKRFRKYVCMDTKICISNSRRKEYKSNILKRKF